mgnify:CR=1 FL=1
MKKVFFSFLLIILGTGLMFAQDPKASVLSQKSKVTSQPRPKKSASTSTATAPANTSATKDKPAGKSANTHKSRKGKHVTATKKGQKSMIKKSSTPTTK